MASYPSRGPGIIAAGVVSGGAEVAPCYFLVGLDQHRGQDVGLSLGSGEGDVLTVIGVTSVRDDRKTSIYNAFAHIF